MNIRKEEIVATIWHDEALGIAIVSILLIIVSEIVQYFISDGPTHHSMHSLEGLGLGMILIVAIMWQVENIRKRPDADKFKAMTYINKLLKNEEEVYKPCGPFDNR